MLIIILIHLCLSNILDSNVRFSSYLILYLHCHILENSPQEIYKFIWRKSLQLLRRKNIKEIIAELEELHFAIGCLIRKFMVAPIIQFYI